MAGPTGQTRDEGLRAVASAGHGYPFIVDRRLAGLNADARIGREIYQGRPV